MNDLLRHLSRQFRYDDWANRETLATLVNAQDIPPRALDLLAHVVAAEYIWLDRLHGQRSTIAVWPEMAITDVTAHLDSLPQGWDAYLKVAALDDVVAYENSKGERFTNAVLDILTHVINHGTYHRAQIATVMRQEGLQPPYTDWIHAARNHFI